MRNAREEQFRQLQRMDAVGRLTGGVAHDFNNLLAIIHGNSKCWRRLRGRAGAAAMADDVIGAAARGAELVAPAAGLRAACSSSSRKSIDLNARVQNVRDLLQRALGEHDRPRGSSRRRAVAGDWSIPTQVDDALLNLAINARDAMPDGGTLTIETRERLARRGLCRRDTAK